MTRPEPKVSQTGLMGALSPPLMMTKSIRAARGVSNGNRTPAGFDADAANMLADDMAAAEFIQFLVTGAVVESLRRFVDGRRRAVRQTADAGD